MTRAEAEEIAERILVVGPYVIRCTVGDGGIQGHPIALMNLRDAIVKALLEAAEPSA